MRCPSWPRPPASKRGDVAAHVRWRRVGRCRASGHHVPLGDGPEPAPSQLIAGGQSGPHLRRPDQGGVGHAQRLEHVHPQVVGQAGAGGVLDDLTEDRRGMVGVHEPAPGLSMDAHAGPVELGQRGQGVVDRHALAEVGQEHAPGPGELAEAGRVGQQVPDGRGGMTVGVDLERAEMRLHRVVQTKPPLLAQLQDRDPGHRLGDRGDAEHGPRSDRSPACHIGLPVSSELVGLPVADDRDREPDHGVLRGERGHVAREVDSAQRSPLPRPESSREVWPSSDAITGT